MRTPKIMDGDLVFENGDVVMVDGDEELAQSLETIFRTRKGEWFLNEQFGLDFEPFLTKRFDETMATDAIAEAAAQEERIQRIENISFRREGRKLYVELTLVKSDGQTLSIGEVNVIG
ncbi:hypothetical protein [Deep-sea thermophilic phage D6E]|uniref:baseplate wedge subunit n=1 Tax=Deep-sea thermophilic phage D6E TaxID=749413 RepID=UPI0001F390E9|nr:baseplate wedge subunit [Deep-sea thermophilic phage D6E]ADE87500.1 hypothetical protein [Deep-sea thermophilic phage D6E]